MLTALSVTESIQQKSQKKVSKSFAVVLVDFITLLLVMMRDS
jgi:hypothetical protein